MCEEAPAGVTSAASSIVSGIPEGLRMVVGGTLGVAAAAALLFVVDNIVLIEAGVAVLATAAVTVLAVKTRRELRSVTTWRPDRAGTVRRPAIEAPARAARPVAAAERQALPVGRPVRSQPDTMRSLAELGGAILAVKTAQPAVREG